MVSTLQQNKLSKTAWAKRELLRCKESCAYFIHNYCRIYDSESETWIPFRLWPFQRDTIKAIDQHQLTVIMKARQLGETWVCIGYIEWRMIFRPVTSALLFSRREDEAKHLLERLTGMYSRLPSWLQTRKVVTNNTSVFELSNGSIARAFPTSAGDSYTATIALADEFDLVEDQAGLMRAVKPTIEKGRMILLSRVDKDKPQSIFKKIHSAAREGKNNWHAVFLPWFVRPDRTKQWYEEQRADSIANTGSLDDVHEQYPATVEEALSPRALGKRIPPAWLLKCYQAMVPLASPAGAPSIPDLKIYRMPEVGQVYVIGADPAEGNPTSDDSSLTVLDKLNGEEVASLAGKFEPSTFAAYLLAISTFFNNANILPERNNHGHSVLLWLRDNGGRMRLLAGRDGKAGWMSSTLGKSTLYDTAADAFKNGETQLHTETTFNQLSSIEGATLRAPKDEPDDYADSYALALQARLQKVGVIAPIRPDIAKVISGKR